MIPTKEEFREIVKRYFSDMTDDEIDNYFKSFIYVDPNNMGYDHTIVKYILSKILRRYNNN